MWYENSVIMTFIGAAFGALVGCIGAILSSLIELKKISNQQKFEKENRKREKVEEVCSNILQSIYSIQRMSDGLIKSDVAAIKNESYILMAKAKMYCNSEVVDLYNEFLSDFFNKKIYNGNLVDNKLVPAIRENIE